MEVQKPLESGPSFLPKKRYTLQLFLTAALMSENDDDVYPAIVSRPFGDFFVK